jgi:hypothetical protein
MLQASVCSWHECAQYEQQSVQAGLMPESKICILCSWWDFEIGAFVIVLVCLEIVCKMHRRVHHVTSHESTPEVVEFYDYRIPLQPVKISIAIPWLHLSSGHLSAQADCSYQEVAVKFTHLDLKVHNYLQWMVEASEVALIRRQRHAKLLAHWHWNTCMQMRTKFCTSRGSLSLRDINDVMEVLLLHLSYIVCSSRNVRIPIASSHTQISPSTIH